MQIRREVDMRARIRVWGNSLALRIPKHLADETGLKADSPVDIRVERGALVIAPVAKPAYELDELLVQITPDNLHGETETGEPVGNEAW